jgi:transcription antitermination factor NusG
VLTVRGVVAVVGGKGGPEPVAPRELEAVRALVDGPLRYDPCPFLEVGMEVEVIRGSLLGVRGRLLRKGRTSRLIVGVNLIRQGVSLDIDAADVRPV